jgi:hypothetical protein
VILGSPSNCGSPTTSTSTCGRRGIVYAIIHALGGKLDDNLSFIGRLTEIDRCIALNERRPSNR